MRTNYVPVRVYHALASSFNVSGWIEAHARANGQPVSFLRHLADNCDLLQQDGWTHLFATGGFPQGTVNAKRSPYCVRDHRSLDPAFGSATDIRALRSAGLGVVLDLVLNHTAIDHPWRARPEFYLPCPGGCTGTAHCCWDRLQRAACWDNRLNDGRGGRRHWSDVLQLNLANEQVWQEHDATTRTLCDWGVSGVRVDSSDVMDPDVFERTWGVRPQKNYLGELVSQHPYLLWIAESYSGMSGLETCGFGVVYDSAERKGEYAWRDALAKPTEPWVIQQTIQRVAVQFNRGGALPLIDCGNHDQPAPLRRYGKWLSGVAGLTYLAPCGVLHLGGNEANFDAWDDSLAAAEMECRPQPLTTVDCKVNWSGGPATALYQGLFDCWGEISSKLGREITWNATITDGLQGWVGYKVQGEKFSYTVLANPTDKPVTPPQYPFLTMEAGEYRVLFQDEAANRIPGLVQARVGKQIRSPQVYVDPTMGMAYLEGEAENYYAKQVATHVAMNQYGSRLRVVNNIVVV